MSVSVKLMDYQEIGRLREMRKCMMIGIER
jgi:hypothetical protein